MGNRLAQVTRILKGGTSHLAFCQCPPPDRNSGQGIFDTDFDKYTEDAVDLFTKCGVNTGFENLEGFPEDWKTNVPAFVKFVREHPYPSFLE